MSEPVRIPEEDQPQAGTINAEELVAIQARTSVFDDIDRRGAELQLELEMLGLTRQLLSRESAAFVNMLIAKYVDVSHGHLYRIDPKTGAIFQTTRHGDPTEQPEAPAED